jgi:hypothetical protein
MSHASKHIPLSPAFERLARETAPANALRPVPTSPMSTAGFSAPLSGTLSHSFEQWAQPKAANPFEELAERSQTASPTSNTPENRHPRSVPFDGVEEENQQFNPTNDNTEVGSPTGNEFLPLSTTTVAQAQRKASGQRD